MPTPANVQKMVEEIRKSAAHYQYFFNNLTSSAWLGPLAAEGFFKNPPGRADVDGGFVFPAWPASAYLARMATVPNVQSDVLRIVQSMPETENVNVNADLLQIALALPARDAATLVKRARAWVQSPYGLRVHLQMGEFIAHLASGSATKAALQLARDTFALQPRADTAGDALFPIAEPRGWLDEYHFDQELMKAVPALITADPKSTFSWLCYLLNEALEQVRRPGDSKLEDYSGIWREAIEKDEYPPRLRSTIITAVRNAAEQATRDNPDNRQFVLGTLRRYQWPVFRRIEYHLMRRFPKVFRDEIADVALSIVELNDSTKHEGALLLKDAFATLPADIQANVLQHIDNGPAEQGLVRWLEFINKPATPERIVELSDYWRAERFSLIAAQVPATWQARVQDVINRAGVVRALDETDGPTVWVGPQSPKSTDDLRAMQPEQVLEFLQDWTPSGDLLASSPEGLGRVLAEAIPDKIAEYAARANEFQSLDPTFVRFFFTGIENALKAEREFEWERVLRLAAWVMAQPRSIVGRHKRLGDADPDWGWTRSAIAGLLETGMHDRKGEIPNEHRELVWSILAMLAADPDPTPAHEAQYGGSNMDPPTLAINTVRGKALIAIILYALWVRRHLDRQSQPPPLTLDTMPEVRDVLEQHLDIPSDPSIAVRSVYGRFFPWLVHLDRSWASAAVPRVFAQQAPYWDAAWNAYLQFCQAYNDVLPILRAQYDQAIKEVARPVAKGQHKPQVGEHLIAYYWHGQILIDDPLLHEFFRLAPDELRGATIEYVGRSLHNAKTRVDATVGQRLQALWEWRLQAAQTSVDRGNHRQELANFGWWFTSRRFDDAWSIKQLQAALEIARVAEPDFKIAETLEQLAPQFPLQAIQCITSIVEGDEQDWTTYGNRDHIMGIIRKVLASNDLAAHTVSRHLIEYLIGRGHFEFRGIVA